MRLLLDQNLSPRLLTVLGELYPGSTHGREVGLQAADDDTVWRYAAQQGFAIASKDADFHERSFLRRGDAGRTCDNLAGFAFGDPVQPLCYHAFDDAPGPREG